MRHAASAGGTDTVALQKQIVAEQQHVDRRARLRRRGRTRATRRSRTRRPSTSSSTASRPGSATPCPRSSPSCAAGCTRILTDPHDTPISGNEPWETRLTLVDQWLLQQPLLKPRVDAADALYQKLLDQWATFAKAPAASTAAR